MLLREVPVTRDAHEARGAKRLERTIHHGQSAQEIFTAAETIATTGAAEADAIQSLTYSLAQQLVERGIRVNGVAPGPVWTPLIPDRCRAAARHRQNVVIDLRG